MVPERRVLLRVEHLEQRRRRVAPEVVAELVDLVQHEHRVLRLAPPEPLDDLTGQGADVRSPVTADLGLVADPAERDPVELPPQRPRDRPAERRLADAGRAHEAEDRGLALGPELPHREVLQEALLDLGQAPVVLVEHLAGPAEIDVVRGLLPPREGNEPLEVGAGDRVLGRRRRHLLEAAQLTQRLAVRLLRHPGRLDLLPQLGQLVGALVAFAQLLLDRLQLLPQVVLPLRLGHLALNLRVDLRPELQDLGFLREGAHERLQARLHVGRLEERLALDGGQGGQHRRDQVDRPPRVAGAGDERQQVVGQGRGQLDDPLEERERLAPERLSLDVVGRRHDVRHPLDPGPEVRRGLGELHHPEPLDAPG